MTNMTIIVKIIHIKLDFKLNFIYIYIYINQIYLIKFYILLAR